MINGLWTLYLASPSNKPELKPLLSLVFNYILDFITSCSFQHPLMLMLDEFTNFGFVRGLPQKLTLIRHDGVPVVLGVQDYTQLELLYDKEAKLLISQPATRLFFKPNDFETAQHISKMIGECITTKERVTSSGQLQENERKEPLLTPDDLLNLGVIGQPDYNDQARQLIAFLPNTRPIRLPALSWRRYLQETDPSLYPPPPVPPLNYQQSLTPAGDKPAQRQTNQQQFFTGW